MFAASLLIACKANETPPGYTGQAIETVILTAGAAVVPLGGNTWKSGKEGAGGMIDEHGITGWSDGQVYFTTYARVAQKGPMKVWLNLRVPEGTSKLQLEALGKTKTITVQGNTLQNRYAGEWLVADTGYVAFTVNGLSKQGDAFADVASIKLQGDAIDEKTTYVKNNEDNFFYWGRRGPSVHLNYALPENAAIEWFYNEVTVPEGNDVVGSYYMANGFAEGYFGIQVNSETERRILFSVWSPFNTDDPNSIPDDQKIKLLKKGTGVYTGEFGNEGSGGQSFLRYNWKAGTTYKFLLQGKPDGQDHTTYTAYFFAPERNEWMLIASFKRPKTNTYLKRTHSFMENFIPEYGDVERKVLFSNQWARDANGNWIELANAHFTADNTARAGYRMDYAGGQSGDDFYLRNCGFFNNYTPIGSRFKRPLKGKAPQVNLAGLAAANQ
ncbi:DUF3472 domain-containing protein [Pontibacter sp. E15-1]|uniref:DUF3472 domain-containing protein n=1 Tax=Pontibacter sp. E15-1 TaxID=2919918 RepID=UPI001F5034DC|nr:DUF3472 domain-containing protein [Pontibacter sp. E15-1]MCJ8165687.1 DUF3472 domain-containing protein [Pontibacter sp. E15-1]